MVGIGGWRGLALAAALVAAFAAQAAEIAGVKLADQVQVEGKDLVLNGAGVRSKFFVKVYVGALYVGQKANAPAAIYDAAGPRRMVMRMMREMDADSLGAALDDGLRNNLTPAEQIDMKPQAEQLGALMKGIGKVKEGDLIALDFTAEGVAVHLNGQMRGKVAGGAFGKALLRVWLGDKPADDSLKAALLGN
jgi:long-chain acyl-CoA synthetase